MTGTGFADSRQPVPVETGHGLTVRYQDRWLYSQREPAKNPLRSVSLLDLKPETLVFCPSPLLGYGFRELLGKLPSRCSILAVEADERLMALSLGALSAEILAHPLLKYVRTASAARLLELMDSLPEAPYRRIVRLDLSGGSSLNPAFYDSARSALDEYVSRWWKNRFTLMKLGRNYARNLLTNLGLARDAVPLSLPKGKAVFLAAAGPSLERHIPAIERYRNALFLAAVDTAAKTLADRGITPDAIILVESQYWIDSAFAGLARSGIPVWADLTARTASILRTAGPVSFFLSEFAKTALLARLADSGTSPLFVPPLGSVGLTALHLLAKLRAPDIPIFFAGLDFAWTKGFTHVRSAPAALSAYNNAHRFRPAAHSGIPGFASAASMQGISGSVVSDPLLADYAAQARALASRIRETGRGLCLDLGHEGLDTGFQECGEGGMAPYMEDLTETLGSAATCESPGVSDGLNGADMTAFLVRELELINELSDRIAARGEKAAQNDPGLRERLIELDYLWLHFPDGARGCSLEPDFTARVRAGLGYYKKSINRALSFLSS